MARKLAPISLALSTTVIAAVSCMHSVDVDNYSGKLILVNCGTRVRDWRIEPRTSAVYRYGVFGREVSCTIDTGASISLCRARLTILDPFLIEIEESGAISCGGPDRPESAGVLEAIPGARNSANSEFQ